MVRATALSRCWSRVPPFSRNNCLPSSSRARCTAALKYPLFVTALNGLPKQWSLGGDALFDRCRGRDGRNLLPPADLPGVEILGCELDSAIGGPTEAPIDQQVRLRESSRERLLRRWLR
jgi:hypothetical protein